MTPTLLNNRYRVIRTLGSGGFGDTFLAEDTQMPSNRRCVIKQLRPVTGNPQVAQMVKDRFQREAAVLEDLGEGNRQIPRLYAYFSEAGQYYLVQEFIEGQTLAHRVQTTGPISDREVQSILMSLLAVLDYVHTKGMIHRDIKPENIILRQSDGLPILIDFGAVKETMATVINSQGNPTHSIAIGTPGFMPSEQAAGRPVFSSDLYSLALTAVYLLTGKIPQELGVDSQTGEIIWHQYAKNLNPSLVAVLDQGIQSHPRDRYSSAREMLDALQSTSIPTILPNPAQNISNMETVAVAPGGGAAYGATNPTPPPPPVVTKPSTPKLKAILLGAIAAGSAIALLIFFLPRLFQESEPISEGNAPPENPTATTIPTSEPPVIASPDIPTPEPTPEVTPVPETIAPTPTAPRVETQRVQFARGASGAILSGNVAPNQIKQHLLFSARGQEFNLQVLQGDVDVTVLDPDQQILGNVNPDNPQWSGILPRNGDYVVEISAPNESNYEVSIDIATRQEIARPTRSPAAPPPVETPAAVRPAPEPVIENYYSLINNRQYRDGWEQLAPSFRSNRGVHPEGYSSYLDWWSQVDQVQVNAVTPIEVNSQTAILDVQLTYLMKSGNTSTESMQFELVWNEASQSWVINNAR